MDKCDLLGCYELNLRHASQVSREESVKLELNRFEMNSVHVIRVPIQ